MVYPSLLCNYDAMYPTQISVPLMNRWHSGTEATGKSINHLYPHKNAWTQAKAFGSIFS